MKQTDYSRERQCKFQQSVKSCQTWPSNFIIIEGRGTHHPSNSYVSVNTFLNCFVFCIIRVSSFRRDCATDSRIRRSVINIYNARLTILYLNCLYARLFAEAVVQKMTQNNVFTIAKRNVEGQDMLYQSLKLTNGIWVLNELKIQPGNPNITVSFRSSNQIILYFRT